MLVALVVSLVAAGFFAAATAALVRKIQVVKNRLNTLEMFLAPPQVGTKPPEMRLVLGRNYLRALRVWLKA